MKRIILTWAALVALAALSFFSGALPLAIGIALAKAMLVLVFFMEARTMPVAGRLAFGTALVLVAVLVCFTLTDELTR